MLRIRSAILLCILENRVEINSVLRLERGVSLWKETKARINASGDDAILVGSRGDQAKALHIRIHRVEATSRRLDDESTDKKRNPASLQNEPNVHEEIEPMTGTHHA